MKQAEKTKLTYNKIINGAIIEFGTKSYENASINSICNDNQISKGLIYHNFNNKDELYLCCVKICYDKMLKYFLNAEIKSKDAWQNMEMLFSMRKQFFLDNPLLSNIFFQTVLQPQKHLIKEIQEIRYEFDNFHITQYRELLNHLKLKEGISEQMAIDYFFVFQDVFNRYFQNKIKENNNLDNIINEHEELLTNILDIMIFGIAQK